MLKYRKDDFKTLKYNFYKNGNNFIIVQTKFLKTYYPKLCNWIYSERLAYWGVPSPTDVKKGEGIIDEVLAFVMEKAKFDANK